MLLRIWAILAACIFMFCGAQNVANAQDNKELPLAEVLENSAKAEAAAADAEAKAEADFARAQQALEDAKTMRKQKVEALKAAKEMAVAEATRRLKESREKMLLARGAKRPGEEIDQLERLIETFTRVITTNGGVVPTEPVLERAVSNPEVVEKPEVVEEKPEPQLPLPVEVKEAQPVEFEDVAPKVVVVREVPKNVVVPTAKTSTSVEPKLPFVGAPIFVADGGKWVQALNSQKTFDGDGTFLSENWIAATAGDTGFDSEARILDGVYYSQGRYRHVGKSFYRWFTGSATLRAGWYQESGSPASDAPAGTPAYVTAERTQSAPLTQTTAAVVYTPCCGTTISTGIVPRFPVIANWRINRIHPLRPFAPHVILASPGVFVTDNVTGYTTSYRIGRFGRLR